MSYQRTILGPGTKRSATLATGKGTDVLVDRAAEAAGDMLVARVTGVESEMDLGFAGLHMLLVPFLNGLDRLVAWRRGGAHAT